MQQQNNVKRRLKSILFGVEESSIQPFGIFCLNRGRLALTDTNKGLVYIVDTDGHILRKIDRFKKNHLSAPVGVCMDSNQQLLVSDSALGQVLVFNKRFKFKRLYSIPPESRITGITFAKGQLYAIDTANHRILVFDNPDHMKFTFGQRGGGPGEFNYPTHITSDETHLYVTDAMNFRVQIFDHSGKFIRMFGSNGNGGGHFSKPKGIAVDSHGWIFVADVDFDNVQIFNQQGQFLSYFGFSGTSSGEFWMPSGVAVDEGDRIWVADTYNQRLQVFQIQRGEK